ncbi:TetR/AcrR family transcriptional regulator [Streptomyces achromogenes]|uniref:TetR/AcrR family transcriptional regulator n=1 Tax=Streptomyces achromogenes TaxID=67255 RepID=A0ABZ1KRQ8_STRAH
MATSLRTSGDAGPRPPALRDRMRQAMRAEVAEVAIRLFAEQGFDGTTVDRIAAEAGLSRASLFRHFGTKEDIVLGHLEGYGHALAEALAARPEGEPPWKALRRAFDVIIRDEEESPERTLKLLRMLCETPSLRARHWEKQLHWQTLLVPEVSRRLGVDPADAQDPRAHALVGAALACLDAAGAAWLACDGATPVSVLLDRAMETLAA